MRRELLLALAIDTALGERLKKAGHYQLNQRGREPGPADIERAQRIVRVALALAAVVFLVLGRCSLVQPIVKAF